MEHLRKKETAMAMLAALLAWAPVLPADPLGFYLGAGVGRSQVRTDVQFAAPTFGPLGFSEKETGWKLIVGIRPLSVIGVEAEYIDFGNASGATGIAPTATQGGINATASSHPKAASLFAVGYLPIPVPHLDVFAKAGAAAIKSSVHASGQGLCPTSMPCLLPVFIPPYSTSGTSTRLTYGAGVQVRLLSLAMRAEYQRIHSSSGDPDLLSLAVTWSFL